MISSEGVAVTPTALPEDSAPSAMWRPGRPIWIWVWVSLACLFLLASWGARSGQDRRFSQEAGYLEDCPFPLKSLPTRLGVWRLIEGGEQKLEEKTARITGCTEYIMRSYLDESTGVTLGVLVLFGPVEPVLPHTPQVCFPATGYTEIEQSIDRTIKADDGKSYVFRTAVYGKPGGRSFIREEAYHSFRLEGDWSPSAGLGRKFPRKNPGVFKVQIQRIVAAGEHRGQDNPIEQFLALLIPEIERRILENQPKVVPSRSPDLKNPTPSTTIREVRSSDAVAVLGNDPDRDSGRATALALNDQPHHPDGDTEHQSAATDHQDHQENGREVEDHREVGKAAYQVGPARLDFGRVQVVSTVRHPRRSSESTGLELGREGTRCLDDARTQPPRSGRHVWVQPSIKKIGKSGSFVQGSIHSRSAPRQSEFVGHLAANFRKIRTRDQPTVLDVGFVMEPGELGESGRSSREFLVDRRLERPVESRDQLAWIRDDLTFGILPFLGATPTRDKISPSILGVFWSRESVFERSGNEWSRLTG